MLTSLYIRNYILIDELEMNLSKGLNTITGETGAGKSIMLGAVNLLMGNRADSKTLLRPDEKCVIEGTFALTGYGYEALFEELDLDYQDHTIIRREITPSGKSRSFINDTPVLLDPLRSLGELLLDVHSQHDTLLLKKSAFQMDLIDTWAKNQLLRDHYRKSFLRYKDASRKHHDLVEKSDLLKNEYEFNKFQWDELEKAQLTDISQSELEEEQRLLDHAEEIKGHLNQGLQVMEGSEYNINQLLSLLQTELLKIASYSENLQSFSDRLRGLIIELADLQNDMEREEMSIDFSAERSLEVNETLGEIYRLCKKHNKSDVSELLSLQEDLSKKISVTVHLEEEIEKARAYEQQCLQELTEWGKKVTHSRQSVIQPFATEAKRLLSQLSIADAELVIQLTPKTPEKDGADHVQFLFSANKGMAAQDLGKVASGGEFSRLMFVFKFLMAEKEALPTFIFDEIDSGVSGEVARQLGSMMAQLGENHQIITITHLPQVAGIGKRHFFVYKESGKDKTLSKIRELHAEERVTEIAKMIAGDNPSESAIKSARELVLAQ